ncbi:MAG: glycosyl transferase [Rhodobacterales bacterium 12-65-15]|nr:MAG: glycosyl transferase [Rhodobacterales bacterium 12-65-15]
MNVAFYAPLKAPDHPVPSGDRLMARMLVACLQRAGHRVTVASDLRAYLGRADDVAGWSALQTAAQAECERLAQGWAGAVPDLWFAYHPYYKSPDLIGPALAQRFGLPYVTCEASYSTRRNLGIWAEMQALMLDMVKGAALNLCLTGRDRAGLLAAAPKARVARFPPFIDTSPFSRDPAPEPGHLVTVAMMRGGDKLQSYRLLAAALKLMPEGLPWRLSVAGDGPERAEVQALFAGLAPGRITWLGLLPREGVAELLSRAAVYVWPGCGEAYGLAYLEAQAAGVPVVAQAVAGVPEVVTDGLTGCLAPEGDALALARAMTALLTDAGLQARMANAARLRVRDQHEIKGAALRLDQLLQGVVRR